MKLEDVIRRYIHLPPTPTGGGWYPVLCKVCNDHGRKGPRAAFKFEGAAVAYHCFNCGPDMNTVYDPDEYSSMPKKMKKVLRDFGIPNSEWQEIVFASMGKQKGKHSELEVKATVNIEPKEIKLPEEFYPLTEAEEDDKWAKVAKWYLTEERGVDPTSYPYMLVRKSDDPFMKKWYGRLVIPAYKNGKLIFFQGRDLTNKKMKKYESPAVPKDKVMYGYERLFEHTDAPLLILEGFFDADAVDGIAILGNTITDAQIAQLNRSPRKKVYIPDRSGDGQQTAEQALELGWSISTPDIGQSVKDMSDAVHKYGKMYVLKSIAENTAEGFTAHTKLGVYCEQERSKGKNS